MSPRPHVPSNARPAPFTEGDLFDDALRQAVREARGGIPHALFVVHVERLAEARAACGDDVDAALNQLVYVALTRQVGPGALLCKLGADRFGLLEGRCPPAQALILARRLRGALEGGLFRQGDLSFRLGARVSAVELGAPEIGGPGEALAGAMDACTAAHLLGNDGVLLLDGTPGARSEVNREVAWREHLREVI